MQKTSKMRHNEIEVSVPGMLGYKLDNRTAEQEDNMAAGQQDSRTVGQYGQLGCPPTHLN